LQTRSHAPRLTLTGRPPPFHEAICIPRVSGSSWIVLRSSQQFLLKSWAFTLTSKVFTSWHVNRTNFRQLLSYTQHSTGDRNGAHKSNFLTFGSLLANSKSGSDYLGGFTNNICIYYIVYIYMFVFQFYIPIRCFRVPLGYAYSRLKTTALHNKTV
jgi:hypothetical protein